MGSGFGRYRLTGVLRRTATGVVHAARDTDHGDREVAVEIVARSLSADPAFRERFHRHAAAVGGVGEPHVVPVHGYGEIDGLLYVETRLVRGCTLAEVLAAGPLAPDRARRIEAQLAAARAALRRAGLGDRPTLPAGVVVTGTGPAEFVQVVDLELGLTPPDRPATALHLDAVPAARRPRRWPLAVGAVVLAGAAVVAVTAAVRSGGSPVALDPDATGLVASIDTGASVTDLLVTEVDGRPAVVAALASGSIGVFDLVTGEPLRPALARAADSLAVVPIDGRPALAVQSPDSTIGFLDLATGTAVGPSIGTPVAPRTSTPGDPIAHLAGQLRVGGPPGDPLLLVRDPTFERFFSTDPADHHRATPTRVLRPRDGRPARPPLTAPGDPAPYAYPATVDGHPDAVLLADTDGSPGGDVLHTVDLGTGAEGPTASSAGSPQFALATAERASGPVAVTGGSDNLVRIWDLRTGTQIGAPLAGHTGPISSITPFPVPGRRLLLTTSQQPLADHPPTETRIWDLDTGAPVGDVLADHPLGSAAAEHVAAVVGADTALVVADGSGRITVWDANTLVGAGR